MLVVDQSSLKLLSNMFKITELVGMGIILLERLDLRRKVLDSMQALYFIEPREESVSAAVATTPFAMEIEFVPVTRQV